MGIQVSYDGELHKSQSSQGLVVGYLALNHFVNRSVNLT